MAVDFVYSRQNMIAEELEKIRAQNLPEREIRETEKRLAGLNQKMQDTTSVREKLEPGQQMQAEQKRLEGLKRQNAPEGGKLKHSSRKIGVTGLRAKVEPGSALDQEAWRDEKVRSWRYGLYP